MTVGTQIARLILPPKMGVLAEHIFMRPCGNKSGLAYWLETEIINALGPDHAVTESGRIYDRLTQCDIRPDHQRYVYEKFIEPNHRIYSRALQSRLRVLRRRDDNI
jgi:hypothetical protein